MTTIDYASRPVLNDSFDFRIVNNNVEVPESLQPFFQQRGVRNALTLFSLAKSFPSAFSNLGVHDAHLQNALNEAVAVLAVVLPAKLTQSQQKPVGLGADAPVGAPHQLGHKLK